MNKRDLEHLIRAARDICEDDEFIIIGSQSLHGKYPDLADHLVVSAEADIYAKNKPANTDKLNEIGVYSIFHESNGYYADPVDMHTATLPRNWKNRLVHLKIETDTKGARAYCLEPHDLVVAKLAAARDKDKRFIEGLLERHLLDHAKIESRINETRVSDDAKGRMKSLFQRLINNVVQRVSNRQNTGTDADDPPQEAGRP